MKLVLVEWYDTSSDDDWQYMGQDHTIAPCWSVGLLKGETDKQVELVCTANVGGRKLHSLAIPRGCIRRIRQICLK
jgi:hypothetical protein